jgi:hypothetical protein
LAGAGVFFVPEEAVAVFGFTDEEFTSAALEALLPASLEDTAVPVTIVVPDALRHEGGERLRAYLYAEMIAKGVSEKEATRHATCFEVES